MDFEKLAALVKTAVTLNQLRGAYKAVRPRLIRADMAIRPGTGSPVVTAMKGNPRKPSSVIKPGPVALSKNPDAPRSGLDGHIFIRGDASRFVGKHHQAEANAMIEGDRAARLHGVLAVPGRSKNKTRRILRRGKIKHLKRQDRVQNLTPKEREVFNRTVGLHEARELRVKPKTEAPLSGHRNLEPPLQDLNIRATLTGPGSKGAKKAIGDMRSDEIAALKKTYPSSFGRLNLGQERLSRHAIKRLNEIHQRELRATAVRQLNEALTRAFAKRPAKKIQRRLPTPVSKERPANPKPRGLGARFRDAVAKRFKRLRRNAPEKK